MVDWLGDQQAWAPYVNAAQVLGGLATAVAAIIAGLTLVAIYVQSQFNAQISREAAALDTHKQYIRLCLDRPELSSAEFALRYTGLRSFDGVLVHAPTKKTEEVLWFLSYLLFAMEQILTVTRNRARQDPSWLATVRDQLGYHQLTLNAVWPVWRDHYGSVMRTVVDEVLNCPLREDGLLDD